MGSLTFKKTALSISSVIIQEAIGATLLPILHRLEQVSSNQHIGTLAENVMEELMQNKKVAKQVCYFTVVTLSAVVN